MLRAAEEKAQRSGWEGRRETGEDAAEAAGGEGGGGGVVTAGSWAFRDQGEAGRPEGYRAREGKWTVGHTWARV